MKEWHISEKIGTIYQMSLSVLKGHYFQYQVLDKSLDKKKVGQNWYYYQFFNKPLKLE